MIHTYDTPTKLGAFLASSRENGGDKKNKILKSYIHQLVDAQPHQPTPLSTTTSHDCPVYLLHRFSRRTMKTFPAEILSISAIELSRRLHAREITAVEVLRTTLDRIDNVNPKIRAIVALRKGMKAAVMHNCQSSLQTKLHTANLSYHL